MLETTMWNHETSALNSSTCADVFGFAFSAMPYPLPLEDRPSWGNVARRFVGVLMVYLHPQA